MPRMRNIHNAATDTIVSLELNNHMEDITEHEPNHPDWYVVTFRYRQFQGDYVQFLVKKLDDDDFDIEEVSSHNIRSGLRRMLREELITMIDPDYEFEGSDEEY